MRNFYFFLFHKHSSVNRDVFLLKKECIFYLKTNPSPQPLTVLTQSSAVEGQHGAALTARGGAPQSPCRGARVAGGRPWPLAWAARTLGIWASSLSPSPVQPARKNRWLAFQRHIGKEKRFFFPLFLFPFACFISKLQLLADQNLKFIDPFCKIAAKTKE